MSESVMCVVPVCVGKAVGYYCANVHKVFVGVPAKESEPTARPFYCLYSWDVISPTGFECLGGKEINRKWRVSIRVVTEDGCEGKTLGQWLKDHDLEGLIPNHFVSSPNRKSKKSSSSASGTGTKIDVLEIRKSPTKRKSSPMKSFAERQSPTKWRDGGMKERSHSQRPAYDVHADASFCMAQFKDFLPVVTSGTPIVSNAWKAMHDEDSPICWLSEKKPDMGLGYDDILQNEAESWRCDPYCIEPYDSSHTAEVETEDLVPFEQSLSKLLDL